MTRSADPSANINGIVTPYPKKKGALKTRLSAGRIPVTIPITVAPSTGARKPDWIRVKAPSEQSRFLEIKKILREHKLHTVCEEASCPNIGECFGKGTATFMIMGDKCTRRCPFCDVGHGRPDPLDPLEPENLAKTIAALGLRYVVITSVDRDDLKDGGASHFVSCIEQVRSLSPRTQIEVLVPDFRGRLDRALEVLIKAPPDVMNHNLETVPRLYRQARPGADYGHSLRLLSAFKQQAGGVPTKSGIMLGLGETDEEVLSVMQDLRAHQVDMITIGQYLAPSGAHLPVARYVPPEQFKVFEEAAQAMGFSHAAVGPMVRSSYHADEQAAHAGV
ncbi:MAG: lipoyl synthase [Burkholderiaceae bacterium]